MTCRLPPSQFPLPPWAQTSPAPAARPEIAVARYEISLPCSPCSMSGTPTSHPATTPPKCKYSWAVPPLVPHHVPHKAPPGKGFIRPGYPFPPPASISRPAKDRRGAPCSDRPAERKLHVFARAPNPCSPRSCEFLL